MIFLDRWDPRRPLLIMNKLSQSVRSTAGNWLTRINENIVTLLFPSLPNLSISVQPLLSTGGVSLIAHTFVTRILHLKNTYNTYNA